MNKQTLSHTTTGTQPCSRPRPSSPRSTPTVSMPEVQPHVDFQFVNATIDAPTVPREKAVRALIRKQAMKKASAARRKDGNYGKHNLRQYPIFIIEQKGYDDQPAVAVLKQEVSKIDDEETVSVVKHEPQEELRISTHEVLRDKMTNQQLRLTERAQVSILYSSLPATGYELASIKSDFDILDLSTLASMFASRAVRNALSEHPLQLIHQLRTQKQWSYLEYLPSQYGLYPSLSAATDCVIARARQIISPHENWEFAVMGFYCKALGILQKALDDPKQRYSPQVLCATEVLALYELLDPKGEEAWVRHSAGAARLIQVRGPRNYTTDFEKALFMAHTGPIMTECVLNNQRCFLEEESWQDVFRSIINEEDFLISDRSEITINLIMIKAFIPGLFRDVTKIVCVDHVPDPEHVKAVADSLRRLRANLRKWHGKYTKILSVYSNMVPGSSEYDAHCKVFSTYATCLMISSRLLGTLSIIERADCEDCTQRLSEEMFELTLKTKSDSEQTTLFMAQTAGVSASVQATKSIWREFSESESDICTHSRAEVRTTFERWCSVIGRVMPT